MKVRSCLAEFLGTLTLVFAGTGAIIINDISRGSVSHVGIAATFGLVVMAMIYTLGDVSGELRHLWIYLSAPLLGAYLGILGCRGVQERGCCSKQAGECH